MRTLRFLALAVAGLLTFSAVAEAACATTDLNNTTWYAYAAHPGGWTRCILKVLSNGTLKSGTACKWFEEGVGTGTQTITGGTMAVNERCLVINGRLNTSDGRVHTVSEAMLDRGKTTLIGVGRDSDGSWTFSAVRK